MSDKAIRDAVRYGQSRCTIDHTCIAQDGHQGPHRDLSKQWIIVEQPIFYAGEPERVRQEIASE